jgi:hypothetical protein
MTNRPGNNSFTKIMYEQTLMNESEAIPNIFSPYSSLPPGSELVKFKQDNGMPISDDEKYKYNDNLGEQAKEMIIKIHGEQEQIRSELEILRKSNKGVEDKVQRRKNMLVTMNMSSELTALHQKEELIVAEMLRLGFND